MERVIAGIHEGELGSLSNEVLDYADRMSDIFDRIDACMDRLPACYKGEPCNKLMERYRTLHSSYLTIHDNVKSYADDFVTLINKMRVNDKYLSSLFQEFTNQRNHQIKTEHFTFTKYNN